MIKDGTKESDRRGNHLVIRASAGTGKTHKLSSRYLELPFRVCPADRILATTFTWKATGEILARVIKRLADAATDETARRESGKPA